MPKLSVIIPCYYNEANIPTLEAELVADKSLLPQEVNVEYIFVDDGSGDGTVATLHALRRRYPRQVSVVELAGNVGAYNAVVAGIEYATGDCLAVLAADLQDPPALLADMYGYWKKGIRLVIGSRQDRPETGLPRVLATTFHWLMRRFALRNVPAGGFDFVLFDRQIATEVLRMRERNSNIFYLMLWLGYPYVNLPYVRRPRQLGQSRWTLAKRVKLFIDSFVSFSFLPIRLISVAGLLLGTLALLYGTYIIALRLLGSQEPAGWSSLMVVVLFVSAFQMLALGVIGEYVWRGLDAARNRPLYVVKEVTKAQG
ncbi:glycosyltransferase family 2 protein [Hymenobacter taeanensis]|uniref:Glycosyltransferase family 2 protein n=1 Tax=Hymenobacter taeanensis TaxID=2735321 RepID=A0A6M6BI13_9BACT|nr:MULTISPECIES: glycosyltransferase family 2 protein [Hymenobacter]QJX47548.1 glycosyltransferase family 2 protein [Hymenobacter taeanensis]UOQ82967.1 glycosyltransferase family 2 protein [Hymenobacter sp. 5414T-23]